MAAKCAAQMGKLEAAAQLADLVVSVLGDNGNGDLADRQEAAA
jgi:hypothetical protein